MSKPVLYRYSGSVWAAAAELAVKELGYPDDAVEFKTLDLSKGDNLEPWFVSINPNATLPSLVADGKAYNSTVEVVDYLIENAPSPPGKAANSDAIAKIHEQAIDPNFFLLLARNDAERRAKGSVLPGAFVRGRQERLNKVAPTAPAEFKTFFDTKLRSNGALVAFYEPNAPPEVTGPFYEVSQKAYNAVSDFVANSLSNYLPESGLIGGEKPSADDFHVGAWLARIAGVLGGDKIGPEGVDIYQKELVKEVPPKVRAYWNAWSSRDSWKKVYAEGLH